MSQFTPIYLGKALVDNSGNVALGPAVATTGLWPAIDHQLVPKEYVDSYVADVKAHYDAILLDRTTELAETQTLVKALESQLNRLYKVLFDKNRDEEFITTPNTGSVGATYATITIPTTDIAAAVPPPVVPQGF